MPTVHIDGRVVTYLEVGDGPAAPVLCVHGHTGSKEDFEAVAGDLAHDRRVLVPDLPGHAESEGPDDPAEYGLARMAAWVLRFADGVGLGDFHLVGHSLGGLVVQRVASLASQRLRSLVLADTGVGAVREEIAERLSAIATAARDDGLEAALAVVHATFPARSAPPADPALDAFIEDRFLRLNPAALVGGASALITALPLGAFLRGIDIPVLVLHGADDATWTPDEQALLANSIRGAELAVIADSAHTPQRENPEAWAKVVRDFLDRAERSSA